MNDREKRAEIMTSDEYYKQNFQEEGKEDKSNEFFLKMAEGGYSGKEDNKEVQKG